MSKIELNNIVNNYTLTLINDNFSEIEDEFNNKVLYRDNPEGEPNQMLNNLDMNSNRILNLPVPTSPFEPARWQDILDLETQDQPDIPTTASEIGYSPAAPVFANNVQGALDQLGAISLGKASLAGSPTQSFTAASLTARGSCFLGGAPPEHSVLISNVPSSINRMSMAGGIAGTAPSISTTGLDTNIDLALNTKGSGTLRFGTLTATTDVPITGYITIKDSNGVLRKLAVID